MQVIQTRRRTRPTVLIALGLVAVLAAGWVIWQRSTRHALGNAGASAIVAPIAPLRLVSAMGAADSAHDSRAIAENLSFTDAEIASAVESKLREMKLPADGLEITVTDREAHLIGRVADPLLRDAIEITVRSVPGVHTVDNRLEVPSAAPKVTP